MKHIAPTLSLLALLALLAAAACGKSSPPAGGDGSKPTAQGNHAHEGHDHDGHSHGAGHEEEHMVSLGTAESGGITLAAQREEGALAAGKECAFDLEISSPQPVVAVRAWIGSADAKGSMKARAEIEDAANPKGWHAHVEVPSPLPTGARLWVEVETGAGRTLLSVEIKAS